MSAVKITVGGNLEADAARRFAEAWRRGEALARVLTARRTELLRYVRRHEVGSIRGLANALGRDYSNVHADVKALAAEGLLNTEGGRLRADYDTIETTIAL